MSTNRIATAITSSPQSPPANPAIEVRQLRVQVETLRETCNEHVNQIHWLEKQLVAARIAVLSTKIHFAQLTGDGDDELRLTEALESELKVFGYLGRQGASL